MRPFIVHFGDSDFQSKYLTVLNDIGQWRAAAGRVESVDLRFNGEAVVNPDRTILAQKKDPPPIVAVAPQLRRAREGNEISPGKIERDAAQRGKKFGEARRARNSSTARPRLILVFGNDASEGFREAQSLRST